MASMMWLLVVGALAQEPAPAPVAGETRWVVEDVVAPRFPDAAEHTVELKAEAEVVVLVVEGDRARVHAGSVYGWVPLTALTTEAPMPAFDPGSMLGNPLEGLKGLEGVELDVPRIGAPE